MSLIQHVRTLTETEPFRNWKDDIPRDYPEYTSFDDWCSKITDYDLRKYGGHYILRAFSMLHRIRILVICQREDYLGTAQEFKVSEIYQSYLTDRQIVLLYGGLHYDCVETGDFDFTSEIHDVLTEGVHVYDDFPVQDVRPRKRNFGEMSNKDHTSNV